GVVRLCAIRESALSVDEVMAAVADPGAGGIVLFTGVVRDHDDASHHEGHHGENFGHGPEEGVRREAGRREGAAASPSPAEAEDARPAERATTPGSGRTVRPVVELGYTAHPSAEAELRAVATDVAAAHPEVRALAATHRVGDLRVGEIAVVVGVSAPHRAEAFAACRQLIDELKARVPLWKHQRFADGGAEWVGIGAT